MKYVLDACVAVKWVLTEPDSAKAINLRDEFRKGVHELLAPDFVPAEVGHSLARAERKGIITPPQGSIFLADVLCTLPALHPSLPLLPRAFTISSATRSGVFDCLYVALAEQEGCQLVTADLRLLANLQTLFPFIASLSTFP
jgi:predicted nucleic acid-binding protein